jgi:hypothetical protein
MRTVETLVLSLLFAALGCAHSRDVTASMAGNPVLGKCFELKHDMRLYSGAPYPGGKGLLPVPPPGWTDGRGWKLIGVVKAGTKITFEKVIEHHYGGITLAPDKVRLTYGRIRTGPYAGEWVETDEAGISVSLKAYFDEDYVRPCTSSVMSETPPHR